MRFKEGDIVLIPFPFSETFDGKARPVLVILKPNSFEFIGLKLTTSEPADFDIKWIENDDLSKGKLESYKETHIRLTQIATLSGTRIIKAVGSVKKHFLKDLKTEFANLFS